MNIGMITQGAVRFQKVRQTLLKQGHRCQSYAFLSTFMASATSLLYDCVVLSWEVSGKDTPEVVRLLRDELPGEVSIVVVNVPSNVQYPLDTKHIKYLRPTSSRGLLAFLEDEFWYDMSAGNVLAFPGTFTQLPKAV